MQRHSTSILLAILATVSATSAQDSSDTTSAVAPSAAEAPSIATAASETPDMGGDALYVHPILPLLALGDDELPTMFYATYEHVLSPGRSVTLQPQFGTGTYKIRDDDAVRTDYTGYGLTATYRFYMNHETAKGTYIAPGVAFRYTELSQKAHFELEDGILYEYADRDGSVTQFGGVVYVGRRTDFGHFSLFYDVGLGFQAISDDGDVNAKASSGLLLEANLGLGYSF